MNNLKSKEEIDILREGGKKLAYILDTLLKEVKVGISSVYLDEKARELIRVEGGEPSFLGFTPAGAKRPYPAALCVSINDEIVHGIPNEEEKIINDGDVVTLDLGFKYKGMYTDHARTMIVGEVDKRVRELVNRTKEALDAGIKEVRAGNTVGDIGHAISKVAESSDLAIMEGLTGHGVGYDVHEEPFVPNYGLKGKGERLEEGMVIAIEPMFSLGTDEIKIEKDGYTYSTTDGSISAQFEHTVVVTSDGCEVLTRV
jgi:methionyl aminopeptidase